jgi:hypothetical protein
MYAGCQCITFNVQDSVTPIVSATEDGKIHDIARAGGGVRDAAPGVEISYDDEGWQEAGGCGPACPIELPGPV